MGSRGNERKLQEGRNCSLLYTQGSKGHVAKVVPGVEGKEGRREWGRHPGGERGRNEEKWIKMDGCMDRRTDCWKDRRKGKNKERNRKGRKERGEVNDINENIQKVKCVLFCKRTQRRSWQALHSLTSSTNHCGMTTTPNITSTSTPCCRGFPKRDNSVSLCPWATTGFPGMQSIKRAGALTMFQERDWTKRRQCPSSRFSGGPWMSDWKRLLSWHQRRSTVSFPGVRKRGLGTQEQQVLQSDSQGGQVHSIYSRGGNG